MFWLLISLGFAEPITLQEAYSLAIENNAQIKIADWSSAKARLTEQQAWLSMLPQVKAEASWLYFDEPIEISLTGDSDVDCTLFESFGFGDLCDSFSQPTVVREDEIYEGKLQLVQPLTPLYSIVNGARAQRALHQVAQAEADITRGDVMVSVTESYMELQTMAGAEALAAHTIKRLEAHAQRAQRFSEQGLLTELDVRQIELGVKDAQLAAQQAALGRRVAERKLEILLGKSGFEPQAIALPTALPSFQTQSNTAQGAVFQGQIDAAKAGRHAAAGQMIPTVALIAGITQTEGQGAFAANEQRFVGVTVSGDFQWGQKALQVRQSHIDVQMAEAGSEIQLQQQALKQEAAIRQAEMAYSEWQTAEEKALLAADLRAKAESQFEQQLLSAAELMDSENEQLAAEMAVLSAKQKAVVALATAQNVLGLPIQPEQL